MRERGFLIGFVALAASLVFLAGDVLAQPRGTHTRNASPASAPTGHQTEPVDLNEGKSPAELFRGGCAVCHQSATGLAKGRREGELTNFLRQHYTSSVQHAAGLANFLTSGGRGGPAVAAPSRQAPAERPPASTSRRTPDERKPQEAARTPEREPASKRRPSAPASRTPAPPTAAVSAAVPPPPPLPPTPEPEPEVEAAPAPETITSTDSPAVEEKPAAPDIPL